MNNMKEKMNVHIDMDTTLTLNAEELAALDALVGYGIKPFLEVFYKHMGESYLKPHESGLVSLFKRIDPLRPKLSRFIEMKKEMEKIVSKS